MHEPYPAGDLQLDRPAFIPKDSGNSPLELNRRRLRDIYHSGCLFNCHIPWLNFHFDDSGILHGVFTCNESGQGYDNMVHGGVIAAIIDASMAQCLMGHGIVGYTTDLSIKYRKPVLIDTKTELKTSIEEVNIGVLYSMKCEILQSRKLVAHATGRFYKTK